jgi:hypothetical protein
MSNPSNYVSPPRYQKDVNVKGKKITSDYKDIWKVLQKLPNLPAIDIAGAEGFISYLAKKAGIKKVVCVEIGEEKVKMGKKLFPGVQFVCKSIFDLDHNLMDFDIFIVSRFFHNIGQEWSERLMDILPMNCIVVARHKRGKRRENGEPREPLAMRSGVSKLLETYGFKIECVGDTVLGTRGKYEISLDN